MNIKDIKNKLYEINCGKVVLRLICDEYWDDVGEVKCIYEKGFDSVGSWRGRYNEPCIFMGTNFDKWELIDLLDELTSNTYEGWKGGDYKYDDSFQLTMEQEAGYYSGDGYINEVKYDDIKECIYIICNKEWEELE